MNSEAILTVTAFADPMRIETQQAARLGQAPGSEADRF